jgi:EAL domain-containing protein (putative c-di-GMP-specific phosphodiesterase class I)
MLSEVDRQANQQYVEAMERLFQSSDFKILLDDFEGMKAAIAHSWRSLRPDQLAFEQGRYEGLSQTTEHLKFVRQLVQQALAAAEADLALDDFNV